MSDDVIKTHRVAYFNFRYYLRGEYRNQYDKAWNEYCSRGIFPREEDIKHLLEFTEYRLWRHIAFFWRKSTFKSPPLDQKTKELIEKICNLHNPNTPSRETIDDKR